MLSFMMVDRIEEQMAVCEIEAVPVTESAKLDGEVECFTDCIPVSYFIQNGLVAKEGLVYKVYHDGQNVVEILDTDEEERLRRIQRLTELI